jgi:hypothetical protein
MPVCDIQCALAKLFTSHFGFNESYCRAELEQTFIFVIFVCNSGEYAITVWPIIH